MTMFVCAWCSCFTTEHSKVSLVMVILTENANQLTSLEM